MAKWWGIDLTEAEWAQTPLKYSIQTPDEALTLGREHGRSGQANANPFDRLQRSRWEAYQRGYLQGRSVYVGRKAVALSREGRRKR